jgi:hypothetical protein
LYARIEPIDAALLACEEKIANEAKCWEGTGDIVIGAGAILASNVRRISEASIRMSAKLLNTSLMPFVLRMGGFAGSFDAEAASKGDRKCCRYRVG